MAENCVMRSNELAWASSPPRVPHIRDGVTRRKLCLTQRNKRQEEHGGKTEKGRKEEREGKNGGKVCKDKQRVKKNSRRIRGDE
jgi:hypothetical protein